MEGYGRKDTGCRQFLDFMEKGRDSVVEKAQDISRHSLSEEEKLELRLGPPLGDHEYVCSYGFFSKTSSSILKHPCPENTQLSLTKESSQPSVGRVNPEMQNPEKKFLQTVTANTAIPGSCSAQKRISPASVVGWPPIRSFRKSLGTGSSSKLGTQSTDKRLIDGSKANVRNLFIKINMDGVPIGRKIDISLYNNYENLYKAVDEHFKDLLPDQSKCYDDGKTKVATSILDESKEYTLVYEDNEGDKMLVGDLPWHMFASTVKRLRVTKTTELPMLQSGCKQGSKLPETSK